MNIGDSMRGVLLEVKSGDRFGFLTILCEAERKRKPNGNPYRIFSVKCDCGTVKDIRLSSLKEGTTVSCGCFHKENAKNILAKSALTHGQSRTRLYWVWMSMKRRCNDPKNKSYARYGARGITVCKEWNESFEAFSEYVSPKPEGLTLDRINTFKGYEPGNVRWATYKEQARNSRRNINVIVDNKKMTLIEATEKLGVDYEKTRVGLKTNKVFNGVANA
jgi:hypothetical protein